MRSAAEEIERHIVAHGCLLHGPHLLDIEVLSALRRLVVSGAASSERAVEALSDLCDLPVERYAHDALIQSAWRLRDSFSAYDAAYLGARRAVDRGRRDASHR